MFYSRNYFSKIFSILGLVLVLTLSCRAAARNIHFSGVDWEVKNRYRRPGPNSWTDNPKDVWVDSQGRLHMRIVYRNNRWMCSEVSSTESFGYGKYTFFVSSDLSAYDPNIVAAFFLYEDDSHEIDIEYSHWGNARKNGGWYSIQPSYLSGNQVSFKLPKTIDYSTHNINWKAKSIDFQSYHGHYDECPDPSYLFHEWSYNMHPIPTPGKEHLHINFWLYDHMPPTDDQEAELVINRITIPNYIHIENRLPAYVGCHQDSLRIHIASNTSWKAESGQSWIRISPSTGSLKDSVTVYIEKNCDQSPREGHILIFGSGRHEKYDFIQNDR